MARKVSFSGGSALDLTTAIDQLCFSSHRRWRAVKLLIMSDVGENHNSTRSAPWRQKRGDSGRGRHALRSKVDATRTKADVAAGAPRHIGS